MKRIDAETNKKITNLISELEGIENKVPYTFKKVFNFPGRKSIDIAQKIIETLSRDGDVIYDPFIGSGSFIIAAVNVNRKIIGNEIDNYTFSFLKTLLTKINHTKLQELFNKLEENIKVQIMNLYETECCGEKNYISKLFYDPQNEEYFHPVSNRDIKNGKNIKLSNNCPICQNSYKEFTQFDLEKLNEISNEDINDFPKNRYIENSRINITSSTGADYYDRLFTKRNQKALLLLQNGIKDLEDLKEKDLLQFALVSSLALSRVAMYGSSTDRLYHIVLHGAQEMNVWELFESKVTAFINFQKTFENVITDNPLNNNLYELKNIAYQSYVDSCPKQKFDMIYTDFPYTDQVPYLEWNQLYRIWLDKFYKPGQFKLTNEMLNKEIVLTNAPSRANKQPIENYYNDIDTMFKNFNKILKDNKLAIFTVKLGAKKYFDILHPINKSLKLREYWFNKEVPNYANKKTMGQQDKSENRHGRASGTQCR